MRNAIWYFDFISPFAYIGLHRMKELPAELPTKRRYTYRWSQWWAGSLGIPLRYPAAHPFNPLHHLRLAIACGSNPDAVRKIFDSIWTTGEEASDQRGFSNLCDGLGVTADALAAPEVKEALKKNTDAAIQRGVFGVPTFEIDGELFWGADAMDFLRAFLADPATLRNAEMQRLDGLPVAAARRTS